MYAANTDYEFDIEESEHSLLPTKNDRSDERSALTSAEHGRTTFSSWLWMYLDGRARRL